MVADLRHAITQKDQEEGVRIGSFSFLPVAASNLAP